MNEEIVTGNNQKYKESGWYVRLWSDEPEKGPFSNEELSKIIFSSKEISLLEIKNSHNSEWIPFERISEIYPELAVENGIFSSDRQKVIIENNKIIDDLYQLKELLLKFQDAKEVNRGWIRFLASGVVFCIGMGLGGPFVAFISAFLFHWIVAGLLIRDVGDKKDAEKKLWAFFHEMENKYPTYMKSKFTPKDGMIYLKIKHLNHCIKEKNKLVGEPSHGHVKVNNSVGSENFEQAILEIIRKCLPEHNFFISPEIPNDKLNNAKKKCGLDNKGKILGLIDFTAFGTAKDCLLFGTQCIYFHNGLGSKSPGAWVIQYSEFINRIFEDGGYAELDIGNGTYLNVGVEGFGRKDKVISILESIQELIGNKV